MRAPPVNAPEAAQAGPRNTYSGRLSWAALLAPSVPRPTAAGKSALAMTLAERFDGEIVSVDSAQVYRGMDIGTAKPDLDERARVVHHLIDIRDPADPYNAARFVADANLLLDAIRARGRLPLLVGGTMLYARAAVALRCAAAGRPRAAGAARRRGGRRHRLAGDCMRGSPRSIRRPRRGSIRAIRSASSARSR